MINEPHLVRYKNDLINLDLSFLSSTELKLFMAICYGLKNEGTNTIEFSFTELRTLTGITDRYNVEFLKMLNKIGDNLMSVTYNEYSSFTNDGRYNVLKKCFFSEFEINSKLQILSVELHEDMEYMLNNWDGGLWSQFALEIFNSIKGFAAKQLFRILVQYSGYSNVFIHIEEAKGIMNSTHQTDKKFYWQTLTKAMEQLEKLNIILPGWSIEKENTKKGKILKLNYTMPAEIRMINFNSKINEKKLSTTMKAQIDLLIQMGKSQDFINCFIETEDIVKAEALYNHRKSNRIIDEELKSVIMQPLPRKKSY